LPGGIEERLGVGQDIPPGAVRTFDHDLAPHSPALLQGYSDGDSSIGRRVPSGR
jgi:hypothetical protein